MMGEKMAQFPSSTQNIRKYNISWSIKLDFFYETFGHKTGGTFLTKKYFFTFKKKKQFSERENIF